MRHFKTDLEAIQYEHARALKAEAERDRYREALEAAEFHIQDDGPESYEAWQKARRRLGGDPE